jgi:ADP-ribose pyrophosphatase
MAAERWEKLSQEEKRVGYKIVTAKQFVLPNGQQSEFTTWGRTGVNNVATIALTSENLVVVARQFRAGPELIMDELPGGCAEAGEDLAAAAARELLEETGYATSEPFVELGQAWRDAYTNEVNHYFLARGCALKSEQHLDGTEFVEVALISVEQLIEHARTGIMTDAVAVLMAYEQLHGEKLGG